MPSWISWREVMSNAGFLKIHVGVLTTCTCFYAIYLRPNSRLKARPMTIFLTSVVPAPIS